MLKFATVHITISTTIIKLLFKIISQNIISYLYRMDNWDNNKNNNNFVSVLLALVIMELIATLSAAILHVSLLALMEVIAVLS